MSRDISKRLKEATIGFGAAVVGIADAELFGEAPEGHRPKDILKDATAVIPYGVVMPRAVLQSALPTLYTQGIFSSSNILNQIGLQIGMWIEAEGFDAIPITARGPLYMEALSGTIRGDLSHKHAAVLAGLGEMGINTLLIHPKYGTRLMLGSVVTNAPVRADAPFRESLCLGSRCLKCVSACPVGAIRPSGGGIDKVRCAKYYRQFSDVYFETWGIYACRECRKVCSKIMEGRQR